MAQSTSKSGQRSNSARGRNSSSGSRSSNGSSAKRSQSSRASSSRQAGGAVKDRVKSTGQTVASGAQNAGSAIGSAAGKAKGPAIAGGAAIAGLVGGMTIASRGARRRVLGMPVPGTRRPLVKVTGRTRANKTRDLVKAAGQVGNAGRQMAELASEVRRTREQLGDGRRRSPVEVVLQGLTSRRPR